MPSISIRVHERALCGSEVDHSLKALVAEQGVEVELPLPWMLHPLCGSACGMRSIAKGAVVLGKTISIK